MSRSSTTAARMRWCSGLLAVFLLLVLWTSAAAAMTPQSVVRVEEDWELTLGEPDPDTDAPQLTCVMSPVSNLESTFAVLEINHHTLPDFASGGVQLQVWDGGEPVADKGISAGVVLSQPGEVVRWTQSIEVSSGVLSFSIGGGNSSTWGSFGGEPLTLRVSTTLTNLDGYSPDLSVRNSGVGYAGNRVHKLTLKRVRVVLASGQVIEDTSPKDVQL